MFFELSIEGMMLEVSPSVELISKGQYKRDEVVGTHMYDFFYEPAEGEAMMNILLEHGFVSDYEIIIKNRDGSKIPCSISSKIIFNQNKHPEKIVGSMRDITDRKRAEEALRESEMRHKMLFSNAAEGILVAKIETMQFLYANPALCKMFGYTEEELKRLGVKDIHPKESLDHVMAEFGAQMRGEKLLASDLPCLRKDGTLFYADVNATVMVLDGFKCNVGFFIDITDRKQTHKELLEHRDHLEELVNERTEELSKAKKEAEEANKAKSEFLANMSHEIRTPMNAVLGYTELLSSMLVDQTQKDYINSIKSSGRSLLTLINDILDLSKIEAGKLEMEYEYVDTYSFFSEFERIFSLKVSEK
jgi:PAS domain S-box-containing protein